jgi:hypothetical protein
LALKNLIDKSLARLRKKKDYKSLTLEVKGGTLQAMPQN